MRKLTQLLERSQNYLSLSVSSTYVISDSKYLVYLLSCLDRHLRYGKLSAAPRSHFWRLGVGPDLHLVVRSYGQATMNGRHLTRLSSNNRFIPVKNYPRSNSLSS